MLKAPVEKALNDQINAELYSAYLYLAMSAWAQDHNFAGAAQWFKLQAQEELVHAGKFFDYIHDRGGHVSLPAIDAPKAEWTTLVDVYEHTFEHEQSVTELINSLVTIAKENTDHLTDNMLQWFVAEQVEEEATVSDLLGKLRLVGDNGAGLFMIDNELGQRVFTLPPQA